MTFYGILDRDNSLDELKVSKLYIMPENSSKQIELTGEQWYELVATMNGEKECLANMDGHEYMPKSMTVSNESFFNQ